MNNETLNQMTVNLLESLDKDELLNQKGISAIVSLIKRDDSRAAIRHAIKSTNGDKLQYAEGIKALVALYDNSAAISVRGLCEQAATDKAPRRFLEEKIIPLLVDLGVIIRAGERSNHWQAFDRIGTKAGLLDNFKAMLEVTPEKLALRAAQDRATDEARLLTITKKQAAIANNRKATALQAVNASQEAERIAATLPKGNQGAAGWITQNPGIAISLALALVVVVGGRMTGDNTNTNTVQLATMPTTTTTMGTSK